TGGTASTRRDESENITVVKGIRLSENVIDRMKKSSPSGSKSPRYSGELSKPLREKTNKQTKNIRIVLGPAVGRIPIQDSRHGIQILG
uniref:Uncharacterized protein n=1 Tax=Microcebus murinus TaxID=30608 RepID=A0A8C5XZH4_MICMU